MRMPRHGFSLLRLANGDVLALGGYDGFNALTSCRTLGLSIRRFGGTVPLSTTQSRPYSPGHVG